ncbi:MAG TPA: septal ring lytic transglycosylase RlpA family protein [Candidatus Acidoferrales bacterium]|nr:septal ring lytic transglycosylase RlpA family protein [Candidatus Acidoferrales bacterium]
MHQTRCEGITLLRRLALLSAVALAAAGCAHRTYTPQAPAPAPIPQPPATSAPPPSVETQPAVPGQYVEEGVASWYGVPFDGHRTSNGEIYDMHAFTAAHRTLPFGSLVRVTNLRNGMQTEVRINDRGPFVANRIIDLSLSAAQAIQMVGPGTAPVRLEVISGPNPGQGYFGVQVGAFANRENADRLEAQLAMRYSSVSVASYDSPNGLFYRVRVGRLPTEEATRQLAAQIHANDQFTTFVVRLDN